MTPSLMDKLRMIDSGGHHPQTAPGPQPDCQPGEMYHGRESFPSSLFVNPGHALSPGLLDRIFGESFPPRLNLADFVFLDTETTGLSGGVGTVAFQIGLGYFEEGRFVVEQFLMRDYHEEPAMLRELVSRLARFEVLVSFNGRAFDVPLLKSRLVLGRLDAGRLSMPHADLLYPSRRLWKLRLGNCRLCHLEEALLGVSREDDLPGALVPQTYFQYLKDRNFDPIRRILDHNRQDVVSLAQLFFFLCRAYDRPEGIAHGQDLLSLGRFYEKRGMGQQAAKCYRLCARGCTRPEAFAALASQSKRLGKVENAVRLYSVMLARGDQPAQAGEALAKIYEHQYKDIPRALHYTRQALLALSEPSLFPDASIQEKRIALQYRYARLLRKQGKQIL